MEQWIYENLIVEKHSIYSACRSTLNDVSNRDYSSTKYFNLDIKCMDMDTYEKKVLHKAQADNTVDAVIGISSYKNNHMMNSRLLLIELRINYKSTNTLSKTNMERKVTYTKSLLGGELPINKESLFIFNENVAPQAKNWFNRQSRTGGELVNCIVCSVADFSLKIKSASDFPYVPMHKEETIKFDICQYEDKAIWPLFFKQIRYWCQQACNYQYKNFSEYTYIVNVIKAIWLSFKNKRHTFNENEKLEILLLEEDFEFIKT